MSLKELYAEKARIAAQIKAAKEAEKASAKYYYTLEKGVVKMYKAVSIPTDRPVAFWDGEKGAKTLNATESFVSIISKLTKVTGDLSFRIKPILSENGFIWDPETKSWVKPAAESAL